MPHKDYLFYKTSMKEEANIGYCTNSFVIKLMDYDGCIVLVFDNMSAPGYEALTPLAYDKHFKLSGQALSNVN